MPVATQHEKDTALAVVDPEVDAVLAFLEEAAHALAMADAESAKKSRGQAAAALILARHKRSGELHRSATAVKLRAEARLGELAGAPMAKADAAKLKGKAKHAQPERAQVQENPLVGLDHNDVARCRKVWGAAKHLERYLDHVKQAGEEPTRTGFLSFAGQQEAAEARTREDVAAEAGRKTPPPPRPSTPPALGAPVHDVKAMTATLTKAADDAKARGVAQPTILPPRPVAASPVGQKWLASLRRCVGDIEQKPPTRTSPASLPDFRERVHADLLAMLRKIEADLSKFVDEEAETLGAA